MSMFFPNTKTNTLANVVSPLPAGGLIPQPTHAYVVGELWKLSSCYMVSFTFFLRL